MNEKIKKITETNDGFEIKTNKQTITLKLGDGGGGCCEISGTLMSEDDLSRFVGSQLTSITRVDEQLKSYPALEELPNNDDRGTATVFVNLDTSVGLLQFVAYNNHNGYYGHPVTVRSKQLAIDESI